MNKLKVRLSHQSVDSISKLYLDLLGYLRSQKSKTFSIMYLHFLRQSLKCSPKISLYWMSCSQISHKNTNKIEWSYDYAFMKRLSTTIEIDKQLPKKKTELIKSQWIWWVVSKSPVSFIFHAQIPINFQLAHHLASLTFQVLKLISRTPTEKANISIVWVLKTWVIPIYQFEVEYKCAGGDFLQNFSTNFSQYSCNLWVVHFE